MEEKKDIEQGEKAVEKREIDWKGFKEFLDEFKKESDRAAVILGVAKLDLLLYQLLVKVFLSNVGSTDDLFDGDAPLSTFHAKIHMAYRLGLIDSDFARSLHLTRRIRNSFAHEVTGCTLDSGPHRERVRELKNPLEGYNVFKEMEKLFFNGKSGYAIDFRKVLALMEIRLEYAMQYAEPLESSKATSLIPGQWRRTESAKE